MNDNEIRVNDILFCQVGSNLKEVRVLRVLQPSGRFKRVRYVVGFSGTDTKDVVNSDVLRPDYRKASGVYSGTVGQMQKYGSGVRRAVNAPILVQTAPKKAGGTK